MSQDPFEENPAAFLEGFIKRYVTESPANRLERLDESPIYEEPLVGFASGGNPVFGEYKAIIGDFHLVPREALAKHAEETGHDGNLDSVSVISWILPIARKTRLSNRPRELVPSFRWALTRHHGQIFNEQLAKEVVSLLGERGYMAVAPSMSSFFQRHTIASGPASNWSERHIAYAAGLGTFGLSDGFITPKGVAMRCGSVVTNLKLPATERRYHNHTANCPFFGDGSCGECMERCPAGAITRHGHDKLKCREYLREETGRWNKRYEVGEVGCGLCQTKVPCEEMIPPAAVRANEATQA